MAETLEELIARYEEKARCAWDDARVYRDVDGCRALEADQRYTLLSDVIRDLGWVLQG